MKPYSGSKPFIFVSYSHKDTDEVFEIINNLQKRGYRVWYDSGIVPDTEFLNVIGERIVESGYFLAMITDNYIKSPFCNKEIKFACTENINILPVFLEKTELNSGIKLALSDTQAIFKYECADETKFYDKLFSSQNMRSFLEDDPRTLLSDIENALVINYCTPANKILSAKTNDKVLPIIKKAYDLGFSHIPIVDDENCVIGVFDHALWTKILSDRSEGKTNLKIDGNTVFGDLSDYTDLNTKRIFEIVFLSEKETVFDIKLKTAKVFNDLHRGIGMFLITETGEKDKPLSGLLTNAGLLGRKIFD